MSGLTSNVPAVPDDEDEDEAQKPLICKLPAPLIHSATAPWRGAAARGKDSWKIPPKVIQSKEEPKNA